MGKSSSSLKKKRSKNSSKAKASRSKIRKHKSKKIRRREASLSSSDYVGSESLDTSGSSSSGESYRRKRDRSRARKEVKGRKKRARRRSYSRDSSEDSLFARKSKKAKRKNEHDEAREKSHQKKKIRREASVDLMGSRSLSCSTCPGGSASDVDSQYESCRGRSDRKEKDKRRLRGRSRSKKSSRYRARSCSSCSPCSESSHEGTKENYAGEENSRRLRSVITVTNEAEESRELCRNEAKEEIVDDHDYPCRSNDSNDGATKRELDHHALLASERELSVEDEMGYSNADINTTDPKLRVRSYCDGRNLNACSAGTNESLKETSETSGANLNSDDLESILRQRALENLRKFRGAVHSTAKDSNQENKIVSQVKQPITDEHELVQGNFIVNDAAVATNFNKRTPVEETNLPVQETDHSSLQGCSSLKQTPVSGLAREKLVAAENIKDRGTSKAARVVSRGSNDNVNNIRGLSSAALKPSVDGPKFRQNNLNKGKDDVKDHSWFELKQTSASHEPPYAKVTEGDVERNAAKSTEAATQSINNSGRDVNELRNSATPKSGFESSSVENNSGKLQDESNLEQKTMNVMRGGKMVQVSYKVHIPNKVPALARRQPKR